MAYVNHFKVVLLVSVVAIDVVGGWFWGNIREYAGIASLNTGPNMEGISVCGLVFR